jgi:single-strand DNA-binding protein
MSSLNLAKITIAGHLIRDPELKMTPNGVPCTTITVAVNRKNDNGNETVSDFYTVIAWRGTAEMICRYFRKGSAIYVDGKFRLRAYTDKNGVNRKAPEIIASDVSFIDSKATSAPEAEEQPQAFTTAAPPELVAELNNGTDDDLPF